MTASQRLDESFFVVLSCSVLRGYPHDPMSLPREELSMTVHGEETKATSRLIAELDHDLSPDGIASLRRSWILRVAVPRNAFDHTPGRWISDRGRHLLERVGGRPGVYAASLARGGMERILCEDVARAVVSLTAAISAGGAGEPLVAKAMATASAATRAVSMSAIPSELASRICDASHLLASSLWNGEELHHADFRSMLAELEAGRQDEGVLIEIREP